MKTFLVITLFVLLCSNGTMGQPADMKTRINVLNKPLYYEDFQGFSGKNEKYERQHPNILKTPKGNKFKSIPEEDNQKLDSIIYKSWDYSVNRYFIDSKEAYTYDANGNLTSDISYQWDTIKNQWVSYEKIDYTYDANFRVVTTKWGSYTVEFTYDTNGNIILSIAYNWDESTNHRDNISKSEFTYEDGNVTLYIFYGWDESTSKWIIIEKCEYTYDANGHRALAIYYFWNETTSQWVNAAKAESIYDDNGNMTLNVYYEWDETSSQWVNFS